MEILEAFDLTGCAHSAAQLAGTDRKTVARYVALRDAGADPLATERRSRSIDSFLAKVEELVDRSSGKIRADVVHRRLSAMGYGGAERTTRRAVAEAKAAWQAGHRRSYRPWIPEPGMWLQWDWGEGPRIGGRRTQLFCCWLAWSRFRVVLPSWDQGLGSLTACLDRALRIIGGAPAYLLTDNAKTVTIEHVAGIPIRHPDMVALGRHYGCTVQTCRPFDPESKGGTEATVKIAKADLVPAEANLRKEYASFGELEAGCEQFSERAASTARAPRCPGSGWPPSGHICTRCRPSRMHWHSGRSGWSATIRPSGSGRCDTPPRPAMWGSGCGAGCTAASWSSSPVPAPG
jgi:transposase